MRSPLMTNLYQITFHFQFPTSDCHWSEGSSDVTVFFVILFLKDIDQCILYSTPTHLWNSSDMSASWQTRVTRELYKMTICGVWYKISSSLCMSGFSADRISVKSFLSPSGISRSRGYFYSHATLGKVWDTRTGLWYSSDSTLSSKC